MKMKEQAGLIVDLDLCMGCFSCEVACKQELNLSGGRSGIQVITIGPQNVNGSLAMDFIPITSDECNLCRTRRQRGKIPFCVEICPTQALGFYGEAGILSRLRENGRFHLCKISQEDC